MVGAPTRRHILFPVAALVLSTVVLILMGEVACRTFWPDEQLRYVTDDEALFRFAPDQKGFVPLRDGSRSPMTLLDEFGFRGAPPGSLPSQRVLVLGDSFTFGVGVRDDEVFSARIDRALGPDVHVWNGGQPGYGVYQMQATLHRVEEPIRPDVVLLVIWEGDFLRQPMAPEEKEAFLRKSRLMKAVKSSTLATHLYRIVERAALGIGLSDAVVQVGETQAPRATEDLVASHLHGLRDDLPRLLEMNARLQARGARLGLVLWPKEGFASDPVPGLAARLTASLEEVSRDHGIPFLSLQRILESAPQQALLIPFDWHPTAYGHCLAARGILGLLKEHGFQEREAIECAPPRPHQA